jgi:hypothetical protein
MLIFLLLYYFRKKKTSKALIAPLEFNRSVSVPVEKNLKSNQVSVDQENNENPSKRVLKEDR